MSEFQTRSVAVSRIVATLLILGAILATTGIFLSRRNIGGLEAERNKLRRESAQLLVFDDLPESQSKLVRLPNSERHLFLWKCYQPPRVSQNLETKLGFESAGSGHNVPNRLPIMTTNLAADDLVSIFFQLDDDPAILYVNIFNGSRQWQICDPLVVDLLRRHWAELEFEVAGDPAAITFNENQPLTLFRVRAPQQLLADSRVDSDSDGTFILFRFGSDDALEQQPLRPRATP